jgi:lysophospholipase L1-like esterase
MSPSISLHAWLCSLLLLAGFIPGAIAEVPHVIQRSEFVNSRIRFEREQVGHVAFLGGSITEMNGYRPLLMKFLQERFPSTRFTFTQAGIASTCSTTGAFRLDHDVLQQGPVDLLFVEFAVNDDQDARHSDRNAVRGMEGIIRHVLLHNPRADIVLTYFVNEPMLAQLQRGETPLSMKAHEAVAEHYRVTSVHHAREVAQQITEGQLTWQDYGGVHPAPRGNAIAAGLIQSLLTEVWSRPLAEQSPPAPAPLPASIDSHSYFRGRFLDTAEIQPGNGWTHSIPDWKSLAGQFRDRFGGIPLWCATEPGSELNFQFEGTGVGAYVLAGPDAGRLEVSLDGGEPFSVELFHPFSKGLHYPRTVMFTGDLPAGRHRVRVRLLPDHAAESSGTAARVLQFVIN